MAWTVHREHPEHFEVQGDVGRFKVRKSSLSPTAIARMQKLAIGGKVRPAAPGKLDKVGPEAKAGAKRFADGAGPDDTQPLPGDPGYDPTQPAPDDPNYSPRQDPGPLDGVKAVGAKESAMEDSAVDAVKQKGVVGALQDAGKGEAAWEQKNFPAVGKVVDAIKSGGRGASPRDQSPVNAYLEQRNKDVNATSAGNLGKLFHAIGDAVSSPSSDPERGAMEKLGLAKPSAPSDTDAPADQDQPAAQTDDQPPTSSGESGPAIGTSTAIADPNPNDPRIPQAAGTGGSAPGDYASAAEKAASEEENLGKVQQQSADALATKGEDQANEQRAWLKEFERSQAEHETALNKMFDDYRNSKIDPNHFWADKTSDDKVKMGIGMLISGIGAGLTGQPNLASQYLDRSIERDFESQKANLGKKASVLSYYMDRMHSRDAAMLQTRAVLGNIAAAEYDAQATRLGGTQLAQQHKLQAAQMRQNAVVQSKQAAAMDVDAQMKQIDLQRAQAQQSIWRKLASGNAGGMSQEEMRLGGMMGVIEPVQVDRQGTLGIARSKPDAEALNKALPEWHAAMDIIDRMQQVRGQNPRAIAIPGTDAAREYNGLENNLGNAIEKATAGRVNGETLKSQIQNMGGTFAKLFAKDPLAATREWANAQHRSLVNQHTWTQEGGSVRDAETNRPAGGPPPSVPKGSVHISNGKESGWLTPGTAMPAGFKRIQ